MEKKYIAKTRKEIRLIKASIRHWQDDAMGAKGEFFAMSAHDCQLCQEYGEKCLIRKSPCPLSKSGNNCRRFGSVYFTYMYCKCQVTHTAMLDALKNLLPETERKGRYK